MPSSWDRTGGLSFFSLGDPGGAGPCRDSLITVCSQHVYCLWCLGGQSFENFWLSRHDIALVESSRGLLVPVRRRFAESWLRGFELPATSSFKSWIANPRWPTEGAIVRRKIKSVLLAKAQERNKVWTSQPLPTCFLIRYDEKWNNMVSSQIRVFTYNWSEIWKVSAATEITL